MPVMRITLLLLAGLLLAACAAQPTEMRLYPAGADPNAARLWPDLPEVPRYRYAGQLTGERNFGPAERTEPGAGEKLLRWITGLGDGSRQAPRVLVRPQSGMVDDAGRIYVTDTGRQALFVFDSLMGRLHIWDQADRGDSFMDPVGVTQGPDGVIQVADATLRRVVRLAPDGRVLGSYGDGVLERPTGIVFDPATRQTFVVDTRAHAIRVFDTAGALVRSFGGQGAAPGQFNAPTHIALAAGRLYVTDTLNARLQILDLDGKPLGSIGRRGLYIGNFTRPKGVTVDADGNVYVVESYYDHLLVFDPDGRFLLPIGGTGAAIGEFYLPAGAWGDRQGHIYVADMFNGRIMIFQYLGS